MLGEAETKAGHIWRGVQMSKLNSSTKPLANLSPYHTDNQKRVTKREDAANAHDRIPIEPPLTHSSSDPDLNGHGLHHALHLLSPEDRAAGRAEARAQLTEEGVIGQLQSIVSPHDDDNEAEDESLENAGAAPEQVSIFIDDHQVSVPPDYTLAEDQDSISASDDTADTPISSQIPQNGSPPNAQAAAAYSATQNHPHTEELPILAEV
jgi:hypothetical protein